MTLNETLKLQFSTGPCQTGGQRQVLNPVLGVAASCQFSGTNPGRVTVNCTMAIPQFVEGTCLAGQNTTYGSLMMPETGQATGPLLGNEAFGVSGGSPSGDNWAWSGTIPSGALGIQSVTINVYGSDQLYCNATTGCQ